MSAEIFGTVELVDQSIREPVAAFVDGKVFVSLGGLTVRMAPDKAERFMGLLLVAVKDAERHQVSLASMLPEGTR